LGVEGAITLREVWIKMPKAGRFLPNPADQPQTNDDDPTKASTSHPSGVALIYFSLENAVNHIQGADSDYALKNARE